MNWIQRFKARTAKKNELLHTLNFICTYVCHISADNPNVHDLHDKVIKELNELPEKYPLTPRELWRAWRK